MPTEVELRTRTDNGVEVIYTRRAVISGVTPVACATTLATAEAAGTLHTALQRLNFFNDEALLFASENASVTDVEVTTTYAPTEETP